MTDDAVQPLRTNRLSLSVQAQRYLLSLIENGTYQPGDQLPSENELAAQLGISRPTLREALLNLEQDSLVVRRHGVGTFVAPGYDSRLESGLERLESVLDLAARQGLRVRCTALEVDEIPADPELAAKLRIPPGAPVTSVQRVIQVGKSSAAYMLDIVPTSILSPADVDDTFNGSVLDLLRDKQDLDVAQAVADIVALDADSALAGKLGLEAGQALLLLEEVLYDEEGTPVEFSRNYFRPECFRFHIVRR